MSKIRKALVAGFGAGIGAAVTVLVKSDWKFDSASISQAFGAFVIAGLPIGWATWRTENAR